MHKPYILNDMKACYLFPPPTGSFRRQSLKLKLNDNKLLYTIYTVQRLVLLTSLGCAGCVSGAKVPFQRCRAHCETPIERVHGVLYSLGKLGVVQEWRVQQKY